MNYDNTSGSIHKSFGAALQVRCCAPPSRNSPGGGRGPGGHSHSPISGPGARVAPPWRCVSVCLLLNSHRGPMDRI